MNKEELARVIRETQSRASAMFTPEHHVPVEEGPHAASAAAIRAMSAPIREELARTEPFAGGPGFMVSLDNGSFGLHAEQASFALALWVLRGDSPEEAISRLERMLSLESAVGRGVMALWGVKLASAVDAGHGVTLLPWSDVPDSRTKRWLSRGRHDNRCPNTSGAYFEALPTAALVCSHTVRPLLHHVRLGELKAPEDPFRLHFLLDDARLALSLVGPSAPTSAGYWFEFEDPHLDDVNLGVTLSASLQEVLPWPFGGEVPLDDQDVARHVTAFLSLDPELRARLRLPLKRFNQAMQRPPHGDRALDLAIALESVLGDSPGENTYKVALRAALLLGGSMERRLKVRALSTALYELRSALAHDGVLRDKVRVPGVGKQPTREVVADATVIVAQVLGAVIQRGSIPKWQEYELMDTGRPS